MVVARFDHYLPMSCHVVIACGLLTAVDLVFALARCPGVSDCCLVAVAVLAGTALSVTGQGFCPLSVSVGAFAFPCSSGRSP